MPKRIRAREIRHWIESYNIADLVTHEPPPLKTITKANACKAIVCSPLNRSVQSAKALGFSEVHVREAVFREMDLPYANWHSPRLPVRAWLILFRLLWFMGYSANAESRDEARLRASIAAEKLKSLARQHGSVLLVGHGFVNRFIASRLLAEGWVGPKRPASRYWGFSTYCYGDIDRDVD